MRFLQIVTAGPVRTGKPDPEHMAKVQASIRERIASGSMVATGPIGKRATAAARVVKAGGQITVEDPPADGADGGGWMAGGGFSLLDAGSKEEAIAGARFVLETMGDGVIELIEVGAMHPPARYKSADAPQVGIGAGVIPYLTIDGASDAAAFYARAFGAVEHARMYGEDGKRLMHCHLLINGGSLMLSDNFPEFGFGPVTRSGNDVMQLVLADGQRWWDRAVAAGCKPIMPFAQAPWGDLYGQLVDPFGVTWAMVEPMPKAGG